MLNIFKDGVVRKVKDRVREEETRMVYVAQRNREAIHLLFADDTTLVADSKEILHSLYT